MRLNFDQLQKLLYHSNDFVFYKDKYSRYLGVNETGIKLLNLSSEQELIGKSDKDLYYSDFSEDFVCNDHLVIKHKKAQTFIETSKFQPLNESKPFSFSCYKAPLFDHLDRSIGIIGIAQLTTALKQQVKSKEPISHIKQENLNLTNRESLCLHYLQQGKTSTKEIAHLMMRSPRTVEKHLQSLMRKFGCHRISELIAKINFQPKV